MATKLKFKKTRIIRIKPQTSTSGVNKKADMARRALKPSVRISKSGRRYTETRANHSDVNPKNNL
jgi:hypothetical protein